MKYVAARDVNKVKSAGETPAVRFKPTETTAPSSAKDASLGMTT